MTAQHFTPILMCREHDEALRQDRTSTAIETFSFMNTSYPDFSFGSDLHAGQRVLTLIIMKCSGQSMP